MTNQEFSDEQIEKILSAIAPTEIAPQHQQKDYQPGWDYVRAEGQRQRIKTTRPWVYRQCCLKKLGDIHLLRESVKGGLYSKVINNSPLDAIAFQPDTEGTQHIDGL